MQGYKCCINTFCPSLLQQFIGPVQSGSRCRGRTNLFGINSLITLLVSQFCLNVRRQRHLAQAFQHFQENAFIAEFYHTVTVFLDSGDNRGEFSVAEDNLVANLHLSAGLTETFPLLITQVPQEQHFYRATGGTMTQKSCGQHTGVIHNQAIAGLQKINNIIKMPMLYFAGFLIQYQQPGRVPLLQRSLGDQLFGQIIPKVLCSHN